MPSDEFFVSAIIPVFNGESFLAEAVASIRRQGHDPLEIIIVDDGSVDDTARVVAGLGSDIRYTYQPNRGAPAARNQGLAMARGNVIAFLDADDVWSAEKLRLQLAYLAEDPDLGIVLGYTRYMRGSPSEDTASDYEYHPHSWLALSFGAAVFRRSVFTTVGLADEAFAYDDDVDWFLRAKELGVATRIHSEITLYYRRHRHNLTNQIATDRRYFLAALKKSLDRRRGGEEQVARSLARWFDE